MLVFSLFQAGAGNGLLSMSLESASLSQLKAMAQAYDLPFAASVTEDQLRQALADFLRRSYSGEITSLLETAGSGEETGADVTAGESDAPAESESLQTPPELLEESATETPNQSAQGQGNSYKLEIESANNIEMSDSVIVVSGQVKLLFSTADQSSKTLSADKVVLDMENKLLTALGSVEFLDSDTDESRQKLLGDIVSYNWQNMNIDLSGGSASSKRKNNENQDVEFFASGSTISYLGGQDVIAFDDALIATTESDPYWSISAKNAALLDGGDLFIVNASLSLGRVPILWVPAFFYPSSRLIINPAIGLNSDHGMFLNTSTEIYGVYPVGGTDNKESSSFASLLRSEEDGEMVKGKVVYQQLQPGQELSDLESWARKTDSFMAVLADVYEKQGLFLGIQTKNSFLDNKIKLTSFSGAALDLTNSENKLRYFENTSGEIKLKYLNLTFSLPYYSDTSVYSAYANRLNTFSLDSVLGREQIFPKTYSTVSTFQWKLNASSNFPIDGLKPYITRFSISPLDVLMEFSYSSEKKKYTIQSATLPSVKANIAGTFLDLSSEESSTTSNSATASEEASSPVASPDAGTAAEVTKVELPFAQLKLFAPETTEEKARTYSNTLKLSYSWDQSFYNEIEKERLTELLTDRKISYKTSGNVTLASTLGGNIFSLKDELVPNYEFSNDSDVVNDSFKLTNKLSVGFPVVGLTYSMDWKILGFSRNLGGMSDFESFKWNKTNVSTHKLVLSLPWNAFSFSLTQTLPPTQQSLTPQVKYSKHGITALVSQKFSETADKPLTPTVSSGEFAFSRNLLSVSAKASYDISDAKNAWDSFLLNQSFSSYFWKDGLAFSETMKATGKFQVKNMDLVLSYKKNKVQLSMEGSQSADAWKLGLDTLETVLSVSEFTFSFWKGRINTLLTFNIDFVYDFQNKFASNLKASMNLKFNIAEFLDLTFSVASSNGGFYRYFNGEGKFDFSELLKDLGRSFDFFGTGRTMTSFNLSSMDFELVHYMKDWNFHCKYNARVVLSGNSWVWKQTASFYVQWQAIPDIKVEQDKEWET